MNFYLKKDIAKIAGVNPRTINRWIEDAIEGGLDLDLHEDQGRYYIAKTNKNQRVIKQLALSRRKYLNKNNLKTITPKSDFYNVYSDEQILEIISNIDTDREIPLKFSYFNNGADSWDAYALQMYQDDKNANTLTSTIRLIDLNLDYLDEVLGAYGQVNIVDIGVGNALPSKKLISHLLKLKKLKRYIAIDISPKMLSIAERNIKDWFGEKVGFEGYALDFGMETFASITAEPPEGAINLVLLLGGTLANSHSPEHVLDTIRQSMFKNDIFIYSLKLDSPQTRDQFNVLIAKEGQLLPPQSEYILGLLGIEESLYAVERGYDEVGRTRYMQIRLKYALSIKFEVHGKDWVVDLNKGESITVWMAKHYSHFDIESLLFESGFNPLQKSRTTDNDFMLIITNMKRKSDKSLH